MGYGFSDTNEKFYINFEKGESGPVSLYLSSEYLFQKNDNSIANETSGLRTNGRIPAMKYKF